MTQYAKIAGGQYLTTSAVQGSFRIASSQNVSVGTVSNTSLPVNKDLVLISSPDYYRIHLNGAATVADPILPPGLLPLVINSGDTLSFIRIGAVDFELSLIVPAGS